MDEEHAHRTPAPAGPATRRRLVTFLGVGRYEKTRYNFHEDDDGYETHFVAEALARHFQPEQVVVIATEPAFALHGAHLDKVLAARQIQVFHEILPDGQSPGEQWVQFDKLRAALDAGAELDEIILDITHGFRAQPFMAAAVLAWTRATTEKLLPVRVVYGAFADRESPSEPRPAPEILKNTRIWMLPAFVELLDWSRALQMLLEAGRAGPVAEQARRIGREARKGWANEGRHGESPVLEQLGKALGSFGEQLETIQAPAILGPDGSASVVLRWLQQAKGDTARLLPPLAPMLDRLEAMLRPLAVKDLQRNGDKALVALTLLYTRLGRYPEAITVCREAWLNRYCEAEARWPGPGFSSQGRQEGRNRWYREDRWGSQRVGDIRNTLDHAGFRSSLPRNPVQLVKDVVEELEQGGSPQPSMGQSKDIFLNISNHPSSSWAPQQLDAARRIAPEVRDLTFPHVDPLLDETSIGAMAGDILAKVPQRTGACMVQGEFTLTWNVVKGLQERGIPCYAATTRRKVRLEGGRKISEFQFVRFRRFASGH